MGPKFFLLQTVQSQTEALGAVCVMVLQNVFELGPV
jgi:hypothetical protein